MADLQAQHLELKLKVIRVAEIFEKRPIAKDKYTDQVLTDFIFDKCKRLQEKFSSRSEDCHRLQLFVRKILDTVDVKETVLTPELLEQVLLRVKETVESVCELREEHERLLKANLNLVQKLEVCRQNYKEKLHQTNLDKMTLLSGQGSIRHHMQSMQELVPYLSPTKVKKRSSSKKRGSK